MTQEYYMISDAAKRVEVETHVLRYWEEELKLPILRNEQGHRLYSLENIDQFCKIKHWKEQGLQLKAIRLMLSEDGKLAVPQSVVQEALGANGEGKCGEKKSEDGKETMQGKEGENVGEAVQGEEKTEGERMPFFPTVGSPETAFSENGEASLTTEKDAKSLRLQMLLHGLISQAVRENNETLLREVRESVQKELDYQFRMQEELEEAREKKRQEREEEHYRKLDELLRQSVTVKKEKRKKHSWF